MFDLHPLARHAALGLLLAAVAAVPATAQLAPSVLQAPPQLLSALDLTAATVQNLVLPANPGQPFQVQVVIDGKLRTLQVQPNDVRTAGFKLLLDGPGGLQALPTPPSVTYQGAIAGDAQSRVAATLVNGQLSAYVQVDGFVWGIEPASKWLPGLPWSTHVVYRGADTDFHGVQCGLTTEHADHAAGGGPIVTAGSVTKEAEIACDADIDYYTKNGSNTTTTQNTITGIINGCNVIYQRDVTIVYKITTIIVRTTRIYVQTSNMNNLIVEFQNYWNSNHATVQRDLAHLFTGAGSFSGVIGIAYLGVVCNIPSAYGVSKAFSSLTTNVGLVSHETGHNWNAPHCDGQFPCYIMCSGLGGCNGNITLFDPYSIGIITAWKNAASCLTTVASAPPTITSLSPSSVGTYPGSSVTVNGANLDSTTSVTVGGTSVVFTPISTSQLTMVMPSPFNIGTHSVIATNSKGSSNAASIQVNGLHPPALNTPSIHVRGYAFDYSCYSDVGHIGVFFVSSALSPSVLPGYVSLGIGASFSNLFQVAAIPALTNGLSKVSILIPTSVSPGTLHWQCLAYNPSNITLPFEVSNVKSVPIF